MKDLIFHVSKSENFIDLNMYQSGREGCAPAHIFGPAARNHYLFHYILKGKGTLMAQSSGGVTQTFPIHAGQGFLLYPGQISTYISDLNDPWTYCWIEFDGLKVKEALDQTELSRDNPVYRSHTREARERMVQEMETIVVQAEEMSPMAAIGHLYLFLDAFIESSRVLVSKKPGRLADFYVKEAISFVEQNYQNNITVEEIAENLGIERSYFGKLFKRSIGKSPQQFLISYRMIKAAELLKTTSMSIGEISAQVGYDNQLHFSRAFKSYYNLSPREWRKQQ